MNVEAIHHITDNFKNLTINYPYQGSNSVQDRNGEDLVIKQIGSSHITIPSHSFMLNNILHYPNASVDLLSVQKFAHDNNAP